MKIEVEWERGEEETCFKNVWFLKTKYKNIDIDIIEKTQDERFRIDSGKSCRYFKSLINAKKAIMRRYRVELKND